MRNRRHRFCETKPIVSGARRAAASIESSTGKAGTAARRAQLATQVTRSMVKAVAAEFIDEDGGTAATFPVRKQGLIAIQVKPGLDIERTNLRSFRCCRTVGLLEFDSAEAAPIVTPGPRYLFR